jgi:hypothetical protein
MDMEGNLLTSCGLADNLHAMNDETSLPERGIGAVAATNDDARVITHAGVV